MIYQVYVKTDDKGRITKVNSSGFLSELAEWVKIDEGSGERFYLAQNNYLSKPIMDGRGIWRYKLADGKVVERTQKEMDSDYVEPIAQPSQEERLAALENENKHLKEALDLLLSGATEEGVTENV